MIQSKAGFGLALIALAASASFSTQAGAAGCNGVVNQLEWGCAAWDNNNGPQYPHYKGAAKQAAKPAAPARGVAPPSVAATAPKIAPNGGAGIVAAGAGNIVAAGAGNAVQKNANGIVSQGAGNAIHK